MANLLGFGGRYPRAGAHFQQPSTATSQIWSRGSRGLPQPTAGSGNLILRQRTQSRHLQEMGEEEEGFEVEKMIKTLLRGGRWRMKQVNTAYEWAGICLDMNRFITIF